jgi:lactate dehydrogenase-like 2-hydroxyacid dehydrogenase
MWISSADHIDFQALSQRNIKLGHTPDVLTEAGMPHFPTPRSIFLSILLVVADITVMLALMASRNGRIAVEAVEAGKVSLLNSYCVSTTLTRNIDPCNPIVALYSVVAFRLLWTSN